MEPERIIEARHVHLGAGFVQDVEFFGAAGSRLFGSRYVPVDGARSGVVVCSPILAELPKNYRREVLLGQALAARGVAVQRFHYRGAGHSDGATEATDFDTMRDDARRATERLVEVTGVGTLAFLGTRLGAMVAAAVARAYPAAPIAFWDPVFSADSYIGEVSAGASSPGSDDIAGYPLAALLRAGLAGRLLEDELGEESRAVLVVQMGGRPPEQAQNWRARGWDLTTEQVDRQQGWWSADDPRLRDEVLARGTPLLPLTTEWLVSRLEARQ